MTQRLMANGFAGCLAGLIGAILFGFIAYATVSGIVIPPPVDGPDIEMRKIPLAVVEFFLRVLYFIVVIGFGAVLGFSIGVLANVILASKTSKPSNPNLPKDDE